MVTTYGKISPLLSLGAGFDHNFSGRKNIILNGAVLGYDKDYLKAVIDNGNEHLLTPLFFYYLVIQSDTSPINPDDEEKLDFIDNLKARLENINNYHKKLATIAE